MTFRQAARQDVPLILQFIKDLAEYENLLNEVVATEEVLEHWLFDEKKAEVVFVTEDEKKVGFALYFYNFSTFLGRAGIYLEDLYILPQYRGRGYGTAVLKYLAKLAVSRGCGRLEWWCLDENTPSVRFYKNVGAMAMDEWTVYRITGQTLIDMAK